MNEEWEAHCVVPRFSGDAFWEVRKADGALVALMIDDDPEAEANAKLIATAPVLFKSLHQLLSWSEHQAAEGCRDIEPHRHARAALALAEPQPKS